MRLHASCHTYASDRLNWRCYHNANIRLRRYRTMATFARPRQVAGQNYSVRARGRNSVIAPSWVPLSMRSMDMYADAKTNRVWLRKSNSVKTLAECVTVSRSSIKYQVDASGLWSLVAVNAPAISNLGLNIEEARTQSIRNSWMTGAMIGADFVELTQNSNFPGVVAGPWTAVGNVSFATTGQVSITGDGVATNTNYITQQYNNLVIGRSYIVSIVAGGAFGVFVGPTAGSASVLANTNIQSAGNTTTPDRVAFVATATSLWVSFSRFPATASTMTLASVKDGERQQNGNFALGIGTVNGTGANGWSSTRAGTSDVVWNSGTQNVTLSSDASGSVANLIALPMTVVNGMSYILKLDLTGAAGATVRVGSTAGGFNWLNVIAPNASAQYFQFTATTTTAYLTILSNVVSSSITVDNVSLYSAGKLPDLWAQGNLVAGLLRHVVATPTVNGLPCIDVRWYGTSTAAYFDVQLDQAVITTARSDTRTTSCFLALVGGSLTNITSVQIISYGSPSNSDNASSGDLKGSLIANIQRFSVTKQFTNATDTAVSPRIAIACANAANIDITLRSGPPQDELGGSVTSIIASTNSTVTRSLDVVTLNNAVTGAVFGASYSGSVRAVAFAPNSANQFYCQFSDNSNNNRAGVYRSGTSQGASITTVANVALWNSIVTAGTIAQGASKAFAFAFAPGDLAMIGTSETIRTNASTPAPNPSTFNIGSTAAGGSPMNGNIESFSLAFTRRVANENLTLMAAA